MPVGLTMRGAKACVCVIAKTRTRRGVGRSTGGESVIKGTLVHSCAKEDKFITRPSLEALITCCPYANTDESLCVVHQELRRWASPFPRPKPLTQIIVCFLWTQVTLSHALPPSPSSTAQRMAGHAQDAGAAGLVLVCKYVLVQAGQDVRITSPGVTAPRPYSSSWHGALSHTRQPLSAAITPTEDKYITTRTSMPVQPRAPCFLFCPRRAAPSSAPAPSFVRRMRAG